MSKSYESTPNDTDLGSTALFAAWVDRLPKYCRDEAITRTKRDGFAVFIEQRNDLGKWLFAVIDAEDDGADDFWMDAFPTHEEAQDFMRGMGWHYPAKDQIQPANQKENES